MGYYINKTDKGVLPASGKAEFLINEFGATEIKGTPTFQNDLVCVVENFLFEVAAYCYSEDEFKVFHKQDGRHKRWLIVHNAKELAK